MKKPFTRIISVIGYLFIALSSSEELLTTTGFVTTVSSSSSSSSSSLLLSSLAVSIKKRPQAPVVVTTTTKVTTRTPTTIGSRYRGGLALSPQAIIETGVSLDTFAPQFLWLPMIVAPESNLTKTLMGGRNGILCITVLALVHLLIVITAAAQPGSTDQILIFSEVFDPSLSQLTGMAKLFQYPNFVAEEWPHVLIWDLFVGRIIWSDGVQRGINTRLSLVFCNFIGPPGMLIYILTCLLSGKGIPTLGDDNTNTNTNTNEEEQ